jgi:ketosteroid isomerase-like protein
VEIVRRSWEAFNRGDLNAFLADVADDAEFEEDPRFPEAGVYRGHKEISGYIRAFQEQIVGHHFEAEQLRDLGDRVLALMRESARGASSGLAVHQRPAFLYTFRGNRIARVRAYLDPAEALDAVGLSE